MNPIISYVIDKVQIAYNCVIVPTSNEDKYAEMRALVTGILFQLGFTPAETTAIFGKHRTTFYNTHKKHEDMMLVKYYRNHYERILDNLPDFNSDNNIVTNLKISNIEPWNISLTDRIYIAGGVTGLEQSAVMKKFQAMEDYAHQYCGIVYNPVKIVQGKTTWNNAMRKLLPYLANSTMILLHPDYKFSQGSLWELTISKNLLNNKIYLFSPSPHA